MIVWVTGARGFIGRHVVAAYAAEGHVVAGLGHGAWTEASQRQTGLNLWLNGDITHANLDALAVAVGSPDVVVHLAGGSLVGPSFAQPAEDLRRSVVAAADLAEWVRLRAPDARIVLSSSAAVYGAGHNGLIGERATCQPFSPYGFHKRMAELALESYARSFGLRVAVVRFFSVYGPGLRKQLLWDCCNRLAAAPRQLTLGGQGTELRDWLHVADAARLLQLVAVHADTNYRVINGGTGVGTSIRSVASGLSGAWGMEQLPLEFSGVARAGDPASLIADASSAHSLGWLPQVTLSQGLESYVRWFRAESMAPTSS